MLYKLALCDMAPLDIKLDGGGNMGLVKTASGSVFVEPGSDKARIIEAEIKKHPTALFFRAKAIKADEPNSNGDYFSVDELLKSYKTFEGVPFFTNHDNQNVENARGKVIHAEWVPAEQSVYTISFVDREAFPHICRSIEQEYITGVSMGASVEYSICNICGNKAEKTEDYCSHIRERKGRTYSGKAKNVVTGEIKEFKKEPVFEYNYGIKFIELSAVVDPACQSCRIEGLIKNDQVVKKVANIQNTLYMIKTAAIEKEAGQQEIQQLNQVLQTLESISIQLIKNRQQIEVEFASDLVNILSELQTFVDELVGAGFGNAQAIPGVAENPPPGTVAAPPVGAEVAPGLPADITSVAAQTPIAGTPAPNAEQVGTVSGAPGIPLVKSPKLPITAPAKPRASDENKMQKIAKNLSELSEKLNIMGDDAMGKRLTVDAKIKQKKAASEILSNSWEEKQEFFEYINRVPSVQDNDNKLSVKKRNDSFVIIAESKEDKSLGEMTWTFETLNNNEKEMIKKNPKEASSYFLDRFAKNLKTNIKGEIVMTSNIKEAGAKNVNKSPDVTQEAQLEETRDLYHSRTDEEKNVVTEAQLKEKRSGEKDVITEAQLNEKSNKLNPRTSTEAEVITEAQLENSDGVSPRKGEAPNTITQDQLKENRTNTEKDVITERQLDALDTPWSRAAKRNSAMFKSAGDHMKSVLDVMASTVIATGCTPEEACQVGASLVGSTKDRYELGGAILDESKDEDVDYSKRLAYWSKKNIKVASVGSKEIAETIVAGLRKVASDMTINPEVVIDALDVITENKQGGVAISKRVDQKLEEAKKETVKSSKKDELRAALTAVTADPEKDTRDNERKEILASVEKEEVKTAHVSERASWKKIAKKADTIIETSFQEVGCKTKDEPEFKSTLKNFARGALASQNIKLAAITNVTISGDTISIAVQTDDGEQAVEIPIDQTDAPVGGEAMPEGDMAGEGLEANVGGGLSSGTGLPVGMPTAKSAQGLKRTAQIPGGGGAGPGAGVGGPAGGLGASEGALPGEVPGGAPIQSLTTDVPEAEIPDEIPTAGEQQPPWSICPECGSSDVDVTKEESGGKGVCNACGAEYEALIKKEIEFKITKPTKSVGKDEAVGEPEVPEVPALPVAAQINLNKDTIVRVAANKAKHGHVCPACGMKQCKASKDEGGHVEYHCPACGTDVEKDVMVNVGNPDESVLRVKWDLVPKTEKCASCKEAAKKFASMMKIEKMVKSASNGTSKFPMANCIERVARKWGGNTVASFGPCKGKPLADCVCSQLEKLGMTKVRHLEKLASVYVQKDPMDECVEDQIKTNKYERKEAETICKCLKKKFASKEDDNAFLMAFADDISSGKEKILTAQDMDAINDMFTDEGAVEEAPIVEEDIDIGTSIDEVAGKEKVTIEVSKDTAKELADAASAAAEEVEVEIETEEVSTELPGDVKSPASEVTDMVVVDDNKGQTSEEEKQMAISMQTHKIIRVGEEIVKVAATPTQVKDIEGNVEAKVPRSEQKLGEEAKADSLMNKPNKGPDVPRKDAYMGKEKEADSSINKELKLPDVAVDSSFMGKNEKSNQSKMPGINNEIKGTVIAKDEKTVKEAKQMSVVDSVEGEVEAKVPRNDQKLGEESKADSLINEPNKGPDVPTSKSAYMGKEKEADSLINAELKGPDVPIDSAYMGDEKEVQKDMPGISDKYLKNVQQKKDVQLERIAAARRMKAVEIAAKLLATKRIQEDSYENVVEALSKFEIDKIASVADNMYPRIKKQTSESHDKEVYAGPAIVMESKEIKSSNDEFSKKIASYFTIGNKTFDENLTRYGEK